MTRLKRPVANIPKATLIQILMVLILASYVGIRVSNLSQAVQKVKTTADTTSYVRISQEAILGTEFLAGSRPLLFPLLLKLAGNHPETVVWVQGLFSIISWSILAVALAYSLHIFLLRFAAFGLILLLSLYRHIIGWDSVLLTESLSLSLMALFIAGWLWLMNGWRWQKVLCLCVVALLWSFSRDTNAWVVCMVALLLLLLAGLRLIDKKYLLLSAAFMVMFFLSNYSAERGDRWVFPFQNVLARRILPEAQAVDFFAGCGMPVSPALMELTGGYANSQERAFYDDPALADYRAWLHKSGKLCYVKWLLSDPLESIKGPMAEFNTLISMQDLQPFLFSKKFSAVLPARLEAILYPRSQLLVVFAVLWAMAIAAILSRAWQQNKTWWVVLGLSILVFPHYFITWHGDVMGIYRHVVSASVQFYLGVWLLALVALDSVLSIKAFQQGFLKPIVVRHVEQ